MQAVQKQFDNEVLDLLDSLSLTVERIDERLGANIGIVKEVLGLHFATVFDKQQELNALLTRYPKDNSEYSPKEKTLIDFYFGKILPVISAGVTTEEDNDGPSSEPGERDQRNGIWVLLVFRMLAWFFLHDFDPEDMMIDRSEFMNSKLPVYIG